MEVLIRFHINLEVVHLQPLVILADAIQPVGLFDRTEVRSREMLKVSVLAWVLHW